MLVQIYTQKAELILHFFLADNTVFAGFNSFIPVFGRYSEN